MTPEEFYILANDVRARPVTICLRDLTNHQGRTLLYGYGTSGNYLHVYLHSRKFHILWYDINKKAVSHRVGTEFPVEDFIPDKRIIPEACDYEFCLRLAEKGARLPWTTMGPPLDEKKKYHGVIHAKRQT